MKNSRHVIIEPVARALHVFGISTRVKSSSLARRENRGENERKMCEMKGKMEKGETNALNATRASSVVVVRPCCRGNYALQDAAERLAHEMNPGERQGAEGLGFRVSGGGAFGFSLSSRIHPASTLV